MNLCIIQVELAAKVRHSIHSTLTNESTLLKNSKVSASESHFQDIHLHFTAVYNEVSVVFRVLDKK